MRYSKDFTDYELIDASAGEKLERFLDVRLIRPDPQIIWQTKKDSKLWGSADGHYNRSSSGGGGWEFKKKIPDSWQIKYKDLVFNIRPTGFKHTGIFPEQAVNWDFIRESCKMRERPKVLNLFAYTGGATLAAAKGGAFVTHVDASKGMVAWARENAASSSLAGDSVRWIVDDCNKFLEREIRRGNKYDAIILDPPSYGRGPGGEIFKLEDSIYSLLLLVRQVLSDTPLFVMLNSYTTGLGAAVMQYLMGCVFGSLPGTVEADEIGIYVTESGLCLPCGNTAIYKG